MEKQFETPILFMVFNRPDATKRVFEEIKKQKPKKLFIAADGPRINRPEELAKCQAVREVVEKINWPCEVQKLFREKNLGCKMACSSAIDWFFNNVSEGIILEDDILPDPSFFQFCKELLEKYRDNPKIMAICGSNLAESWNTPHSYFFSKYAYVWGWASWRRAWKHFDVFMKSWAENSNQEVIRKRLNNSKQWKVKKWQFDRTFWGRKDTWDYQWEYAVLFKGGLSIFPKVNLIENIGLDQDATHTIGDKKFSLSRKKMAFPLNHPILSETTSLIQDNYYNFCFKKMHKPENALIRIVKKIKSLFFKHKIIQFCSFLNVI